MALALFDLDNTLVSGDTPALWFDFLIEKGQVKYEDVRDDIDRFTRDYDTGVLDYAAYIHFELNTLIGRSLEELHEWREDFRARFVRPNISDAARELVNNHRQAGDIVAIVTATNNYIASAGSIEFDIPHLLATEAEIANDRYTGKYLGIECFQSGKIRKLEEWMTLHGHTLQDSWFYSDSFNDLPLLEHVDNPVVVNADERLAAVASKKGWPSMELRI